MTYSRILFFLKRFLVIISTNPPLSIELESFHFGYLKDDSLLILSIEKVLGNLDKTKKLSEISIKIKFPSCVTQQLLNKDKISELRNLKILREINYDVPF